MQDSIQVMIMEVCQLVQEFLRDLLSEKEKQTESCFQSFHEGMLSHQMQQKTVSCNW